MVGMFPNRPNPSDILDGYVGRRVYSENDLVLALSDAAVTRIVIAERMVVTRSFVIPATATGLIISASRAVPIIAGGSIASLFEVRASRVVISGISAIQGRSGGAFAALITDGGHGPDDVVIEDFTVNMGGAGTSFIDVDGNCARWKVTRNEYDNEGQTVPVLDVANGSGWYVAGNRLDTGIRFAGGSYNRIIGNQCNGGGIDVESTDGGNVIVGNTDAGTVTGSASPSVLDKIDLNN